MAKMREKITTWTVCDPAARSALQLGTCWMKHIRSGLPVGLDRTLLRRRFCLLVSQRVLELVSK